MEEKKERHWYAFYVRMHHEKKTAEKLEMLHVEHFLPIQELRWDASKPDGTLRKLTDVSKLHSLGWHHKVEIDEGIHRLYEWYLKGICINHQTV